MSRFLIATLLAATVLQAQDKPQVVPPPPVATPPPTPAPAPEAGPEAVVQQLFDAMAARDALAAKALFVPDAGLFSLGATGKA